MKVFIAFAICIIAVFGDLPETSRRIYQYVVEYRKECITELKLDPRLIDDTHATRSYPQVADCFQACLDKKLGMMNEDGSYNLERMMALAVKPEKEEVEKIYNGRIKDCSLATGNDPCKMAACTHYMPEDLWKKKE